MVHGKTTILNELEKRGFKKAINHTTREKRVGEDSLNEYKFITKEEFNYMWEHGKLLQRAEFNNEYYGIGIDSLKEDVACIQITDSIKDIKNKAQELGIKNAKIVSFYIFVPEEERIARMKKRGDKIENIEKRIEIDRVKFEKAREVVDYVVENIDLEIAIQNILRLYEKHGK